MRIGPDKREIKMSQSFGTHAESGPAWTTVFFYFLTAPKTHLVADSWCEQETRPTVYRCCELGCWKVDKI